MRFGDVEVFNSYGGTARGSIQVDKATPEMRVMQGANTIHAIGAGGEGERVIFESLGVERLRARVGVC